MIHGPLCPSVKAMNFDVYGNVLRVEFVTPSEAKPEASPQPIDGYPKYGSKE